MVSANDAECAPGGIDIEVVHAMPQRVIVKTYRLGSDARLEEAVRRAAADTDFSSVDFERCAVGIFGQVVGPDHPLADGDRVEFYRPLAADPKHARRARAAREQASHRNARRISKSDLS